MLLEANMCIFIYIPTLLNNQNYHALLNILEKQLF